LLAAATEGDTGIPVSQAVKQKYRSLKQQGSVFRHLFGDRFVPSSPSTKNSVLATIDSMADPHFSHYDAFVYQPGEILAIITILDTGGQPEYIHLLPTINIRPTLTFINCS